MRPKQLCSSLTVLGDIRGASADPFSVFPTRRGAVGSWSGTSLLVGPCDRDRVSSKETETVNTPFVWGGSCNVAAGKERMRRAVRLSL